MDNRITFFISLDRVVIVFFVSVSWEKTLKKVSRLNFDLVLVSNSNNTLPVYYFARVRKYEIYSHSNGRP